jgi:hypothetical protein
MPDIVPSFKSWGKAKKAKKAKKTYVGDCKRSIRRFDGTVSPCTLQEHEFPIFCEDDRARAAKEKLAVMRERVELLPYVLAVFGIHTPRRYHDHIRADAWNAVWRGEV